MKRYVVVVVPKNQLERSSSKKNSHHQVGTSLKIVESSSNYIESHLYHDLLLVVGVKKFYTADAYQLYT